MTNGSSASDGVCSGLDLSFVIYHWSFVIGSNRSTWWLIVDKTHAETGSLLLTVSECGARVSDSSVRRSILRPLRESPRSRRRRRRTPGMRPPTRFLPVFQSGPERFALPDL